MGLQPLPQSSSAHPYLIYYEASISVSFFKILVNQIFRWQLQGPTLYLFIGLLLSQAYNEVKMKFESANSGVIPYLPPLTLVKNR